MTTRLGWAKTRHRRLFAFELRHWGYAARTPCQDCSRHRRAGCRPAFRRSRGGGLMVAEPCSRDLTSRGSHKSKALSVGLSNAHFKSLGLPSLVDREIRLLRARCQGPRPLPAALRSSPRINLPSFNGRTGPIYAGAAGESGATVAAISTRCRSGYGVRSTHIGVTASRGPKWRSSAQERIDLFETRSTRSTRR